MEFFTGEKADISLDRLLQEAATPGGTAAATMQAMDSSGYERIIREGLRAEQNKREKTLNLPNTYS